MYGMRRSTPNNLLAGELFQSQGSLKGNHSNLAQQESNLWDQAGQMATHTMAKTFHKSLVLLTAAPDVDLERWRV
jgi:hypothetical protein